MRKSRVVMVGILAALWMVSITGYGQDTTPPQALSTTPSQNTTGVAPNTTIRVGFSETMDCTTLASPATSFSVAGPAATAVAGTVTCSGADATFTPSSNLLPNALFTATVTTAATDLAGNGLIGNFVWSFRTNSASTPIGVMAIAPFNGATGVPINRGVAAAFSVAMNPATINATTFTLAGPGGAAVSGTVAYAINGSVATFIPGANLTAGTLYTATITTGAQDLGGVALASNFIWSFTTGAASDATQPVILSTDPVSGATNVPLNQAVVATFSEAINPATITSTTFTLQGPGGTAIAGSVAYAAVGNSATFTPVGSLAPSTMFTATVTTAATDMAGNTLASNYVWVFTTGTAADSTNPTLVTVVPVDLATGVAVNQAVSATFSEAMDPLTINAGTFQLTGPSGAIAGTIVYNPISLIATFTPTSSLASNTVYNATVTAGATDLAGNGVTSGGTSNPWSFTTGTATLPPSVDLGTAALFGAFESGPSLTNAGTSTLVNGNIGVTGVSTLITGFHDKGSGCTYTETPLNMGFVNGAIYTAPPPPTVGCPTEGTAATSAIAAQVAADTLSAYNALVALPGGLDVSICTGCGGGSAGELGGRTLNSGIYKSAPGTYGITLGDLTLDAQGDPNAFWVFQMATTLTVGTPSQSRSVNLINGAQAKNVFWQVGTAAAINGILGGGTVAGTVIAQSGIAVSIAGIVAVTNIDGRLLNLGGALTMVNTVINVPAQ